MLSQTELRGGGATNLVICSPLHFSPCPKRKKRWRKRRKRRGGGGGGEGDSNLFVFHQVERGSLLHNPEKSGSLSSPEGGKVFFEQCCQLAFFFHCHKMKLFGLQIFGIRLIPFCHPNFDAGVWHRELKHTHIAGRPRNAVSEDH